MGSLRVKELFDYIRVAWTDRWRPYEQHGGPAALCSGDSVAWRPVSRSLHACTFNRALLDHRLGNRWRGITPSPTLNSDILGQASSSRTVLSVCLYHFWNTPQIRRHTWVKPTGQLSPISQTYAFLFNHKSVCYRLSSGDAVGSDGKMPLTAQTTTECELVCELT